MNVEFLGSFTRASLPPESYPEIAVGGRSNVGKSAFINTLLGRHGIAHVSSKPGKTRTLNLFLCERRFILVDLPGYGYARASRKEKARWAGDVDWYLTGRESLKALILLVDIRHFPMDIDIKAIDWLSSLGRPILVVMTKADKISRSEAGQRRIDIGGFEMPELVEFVVFSARSGLGKEEVRNWMTGILRG
jgi:GTP-binding protein